jgi:DNA polymerase III sliding clamp (beta) subunit (PCNA family)
MGVPYVTFIKHAEKVTKSVSASRPVLKGVYHEKGGSLIVTDSHRLYVAKNSHANSLGEIVNPKTGEVIDGNYPDVSRLIPDKYDAKFTLKMNVAQTVDAFTALLKSNHVADKKYKTLTKAVVAEDKTISFTVDNELMSSTYKAGTVDGEVGELTFDTNYFAEAIALIKAAGFTEVEFRYYGPMRPFVLSAGIDDELIALLLPVRTTN